MLVLDFIIFAIDSLPHHSLTTILCSLKEDPLPNLEPPKWLSNHPVITETYRLRPSTIDHPTLTLLPPPKEISKRSAYPSSHTTTRTEPVTRQ
ncbi:predicted protein [Sclerotinia sclerotiorum 1980 UF-70]|uniref:Uncharacterized protein n=1 Tax=Sclerotinia sclerotiorum (strain ATCC 18683 / 1980 / Ss-1) TaxID=665079 RepID=A7F841_SCLS1|nr:predicted protein [Sclerotinia sclerotiorum 1980 UF-70]EDN98912.1 predicted protein [Sclerotinia sclerotiorum 1980 UF-70]